MDELRLQPIDLAIIFGYVAGTLIIGFWISRRASQSIKHYFLGGNSIPWYLLGLSNASGMFDISGTMWLVYLLFVYGLKSLWIQGLWATFNQIFLMVFLSIWLRRSGVMTGAAWIRFRFGDGPGAKLAHLVVVIFAIINVIGFLAYGFVGIGKFAATFLPWRLSESDTINVNLYGLLITAITTIYVVKGGMFSVVFTELLQFAIMTIACVWVGVIAMREVSPSMLDAAVPEGWRNIFFGNRLDMDWTGLLDAANQRIDTDGWEWFSFFFSMMMLKGLMQSLAGPAPNYDMQRVLSARTPREAAQMSGLVNVVLFVPRYMLVTGLTVLALVHFSDELGAMGDEVDFERILPLAMREFIPAGLLGLLIAALLAAFMSTYSATVNAAPAYVVNDIYKRYLDPHASEATYVRISYVTSVVVVVVGTLVGLATRSLNDIVQWLVTALYGGYAAANMLKWYWWRFNSYGYFWGMASGIVAASIIPLLLPHVIPLYAFPAVLGLSLCGCVVGSLMTLPDDLDVLKKFYHKVRPWGWWQPIQDLVVAEHPDAAPNRNFGRDLFNTGVGMIWQACLISLGIYVVLKDMTAIMWSVGILLITSLILKFNWLDKLEDYPPDLA